MSPGAVHYSLSNASGFKRGCCVTDVRHNIHPGKQQQPGLEHVLAGHQPVPEDAQHKHTESYH